MDPVALTLVLIVCIVVGVLVIIRWATFTMWLADEHIGQIGGLLVFMAPFVMVAWLLIQSGIVGM